MADGLVVDHRSTGSLPPPLVRQEGSMATHRGTQADLLDQCVKVDDPLGGQVVRLLCVAAREIFGVVGLTCNDLSGIDPGLPP